MSLDNAISEKVTLKPANFVRADGRVGSAASSCLVRPKAQVSEKVESDPVDDRDVTFTPIRLSIFMRSLRFST